MDPIFRIRLEQLLEKFPKQVRTGSRAEIERILDITNAVEMPLTLAATIIHVYQYHNVR